MSNTSLPKHKRATLAQVAELVKLSKPTVSRALNDYPDISEATKIRVRRAANDLGYSASTQAKRLVSGRTETVALVLDNANVGLQAAYQSEFANALSHGLSQRGFDLLLHTVEDPALELQAYQRLFNAGKVDGFILMRTRVSDERLDFLIERELPFVAQGRSQRQNEYAWHDIDSGGAMEAAVDHLVEKGHRRIAFIEGASHVYSSIFRREGFVRAMNRAGLATGLITPGDFSAEGGRAAFARLWADGAEGERPTGIVCANDATAMGVLAAAADAGVKVPDALSVIGYDGVRMGAMTSPALTTLTHSAAETGDSIAAMFCDLLDGAAIGDNQILAPAFLIERGSVANAPG